MNTKLTINRDLRETPLLSVLALVSLVGCGSGNVGSDDASLVSTVDSSNAELTATTDGAVAVNVANAPNQGRGEQNQQEQLEQLEQLAPLIPVDLAAEMERVTVGQVRTIDIDGVVLSSLPETVQQASNERVELGRLLFWDPVLSGNRDVACATCHLPELGYADGRQRSIGVGGVGSGPDRVDGQTGIIPRNAPTVLNTAWNGISELGVFEPSAAPMFWDNRTQSLAAQALEPIRSLEEMRGDNFTIPEMEAEVINRLNSIAEYQSLFRTAFGVEEVTLELIGQALADFQTTLVANNAPFDRWVRGDENAMSAAQIQGMEDFVDIGCAECHSGPMFSDYETHVLGVREANGLDTPDEGDGDFGFRTASLRQLAFTAPYFHGGQDADLDDVIDFYDNPGQSENPNVPTNELDNDFRNLPNINNGEANRLEQFLNALSDPTFDRTRPASVPSGEPVGGAID